jgi:hypothetical protein
VNREAGSACPNGYNLLAVLASVRNEPISKTPVPLIVNETMTGGVASVIKDDCLLFVRVRTDSSTALLQEQSQ